MSPGACCKRMFLSGGDEGQELEAPMSHERAEHLAMRYNLPMRPLDQSDDGTWMWWCTALDRDGRCSVYENRPTLCQMYAAGSSPLCVHHVPEVEWL
jgi:Fe-S-cluster containining protein